MKIPDMIVKKRESWIDVFKGISILLVILQHCCGAAGSDGLNIHFHVSKIILSFHMSLFFFISGYLSDGKDITIGKVLKRGKTFLKYQVVIGLLNVIWYFVILTVILRQDYSQRWAEYF